MKLLSASVFQPVNKCPLHVTNPHTNRHHMCPIILNGLCYGLHISINIPRALYHITTSDNTHITFPHIYQCLVSLDYFLSHLILHMKPSPLSKSDSISNSSVRWGWQMKWLCRSQTLTNSDFNRPATSPKKCWHRQAKLTMFISVLVMWPAHV